MEHYPCTSGSAVPDMVLASVANVLQVEPLEVSRVCEFIADFNIIIIITCYLQLFSSACVLISVVLQTGVSDAEAIACLLLGL